MSSSSKKTHRTKAGTDQRKLSTLEIPTNPRRSHGSPPSTATTFTDTSVIMFDPTDLRTPQHQTPVTPPRQIQNRFVETPGSSETLRPRPSASALARAEEIRATGKVPIVLEGREEDDDFESVQCSERTSVCSEEARERRQKREQWDEYERQFEQARENERKDWLRTPPRVHHNPSISKSVSSTPVKQLPMAMEGTMPRSQDRVSRGLLKHQRGGTSLEQGTMQRSTVRHVVDAAEDNLRQGRRTPGPAAAEIGKSKSREEDPRSAYVHEQPAQQRSQMEYRPQMNLMHVVDPRVIEAHRRRSQPRRLSGGSICCEDSD